MEKIKGLFYILIFSFFINSLYAGNLFFLDASGGARGFALGKAMSALSEEPDSLLWNPAGIYYSNNIQSQICLSKDFNLVSNSFASIIYPINKTLISGLGIVYSDINEIILRDEDGNPLDYNANFLQYAVIFGLSQKISSDISVGGTLKYIRKSIEKEVNYGFSADLGARAVLCPELSMALVIKDAIFPLIGPDRFWPTGIFGLKVSPFGNIFHILTDVVVYKTRSPETNLGVEFNPISLLSLRVGWENLKAFSMGTRLSLDTVKLDYAYLNHNLDASHRFSLLFNF